MSKFQKALPNCWPTKKLARKQGGQAMMEYVLMTVLLVGVFSFVFSTLRESLFYMWVCDIGPRVQTPFVCKDAMSCLEIYNPASFAQIQNYCSPQ